jgi:tripartite-type tricarboxylate transporter receptor subunit TctC
MGFEEQRIPLYPTIVIVGNCQRMIERPLRRSAMHALTFFAFLLATGLGSAVPAFAQPYPSRPITLVVPYAAGGPADTVARIVAERMRSSLGQPLIIENVTGAGGSLGTGRVVRAAGDGYTIMIGNWSTHMANGVLYSLPYDFSARRICHCR